MTLLEILKQYRVTSQYGPRVSPVTYKQEFHTGIDLVGKEVNDPVESFTEGDVIFAGEGKAGTGLGGFGWVVLVKDRNGYIHMYAHLAEKSLRVKVGDHVVTGQVLGVMGNTGKSTGKHLHYEVRSKHTPSYGYGYHINPMKYLIKLCQDGWTYYNRQGRKDKCDELHETANLIRKLIGYTE